VRGLGPPRCFKSCTQCVIIPTHSLSLLIIGSQSTWISWHMEETGWLLKRRCLPQTKTFQRARLQKQRDGCNGNGMADLRRYQYTAVLPKIPHCNSSKSVPNRLLRGRRGRF